MLGVDIQDAAICGRMLRWNAEAGASGGDRYQTVRSMITASCAGHLTFEGGRQVSADQLRYGMIGAKGSLGTAEGFLEKRNSLIQPVMVRVCGCEVVPIGQHAGAIRTIRSLGGVDGGAEQGNGIVQRPASW